MGFKKVLVLGSGALKIGEAGEFDYSGSQAIKALKSQRLKTILVNPNIATIQTSSILADRIYFLPIDPQFVEQVIMRERPEGILLSMGGQTALNCGVALANRGVFKRYGVRVLGTPISAIKKTEDRELFKRTLDKLGLATPKSLTATSISEALQGAKKIGYPVILRVAYALGGLGSTVVYSQDEMTKRAERALSGSKQVLVEEYLTGWKEIEYEVVRDVEDNCITVCNMENMDPMGIHTGESIVVAPSQTLSNLEYQFLRNVALSLIRALGIVGECNIQFAVNPKAFEYRIIEVNARLSRSSALASKATGYPLAYVAALLSLGYRLDEIDNAVTGVTKAFFEPSLDYITVKIPRWDIEKFQLANEVIGSEMKSVGEVMAIGRTFEEAIQKAARMLDQGYEGIIVRSVLKLTKAEILKQINQPTAKRLFFVAAAILRGVNTNKLHRLTNIDPWFLFRLQQIVKTYVSLKKLPLNYDILSKAKKAGFSDRQIAEVRNISAEAVRGKREEMRLQPSVKRIDTLAGEFPAQTNYLYTTYHGNTNDREIKDRSERKKIMVLGSGPYRIGSSVEFDWCAVNAAMSLRKRGFETVMINCNPETVSTDFDYSDALYFEELSEERIYDIWQHEKADAIILSVGGQKPNNLAEFCKSKGLPVLGTQPERIFMAEDRYTFGRLLEERGISQPPWAELITASEVRSFAKNVGYPILARPSFVLSGEAMSVLYSDRDVDDYLTHLEKRTIKYRVVVSKFIEGAREIDYDAVASRGKIVVRAICEHVERAGVHSGDATLVFPPYRLDNSIIIELDRIARKIAEALEISGPFNIQFLERNGHVMVIECNLRSSRSFPFVSKVSGVNFIDLAVAAMLGEDPQPMPIEGLKYVGVKAPQFSFHRLQGADPTLHVEMASTGEVATLGTSLYDAFLKSFLATNQQLPQKTIFLSIGGWDNKELFLPYARTLSEMGLTIYATDNTEKFLTARGIRCKHAAKIYEGRGLTAIDLLRGKQIDLAINITEPPQRGEESGNFRKRLTDGYYIRRTAIDFHIPLITNLELAMLFVKAIKEKRYADLEVLPLEQYLANNSTYPEGDNMVTSINGSWQNKHIISVDQFSRQDLEELLDLARKLKAEKDRGRVRKDLSGKIMAAIFYEASSRTFGSFITAMQRLGGGIIPLQGVTYSSVTKGELLPDTIRTFANYADVIVLRHYDEGSARIASEYSPVPIINAGDGIGEHPTQALLDLFTISEQFAKVDNLKIAMVGDLLHGRTIHSLAKLLKHYQNLTIFFVAPDRLQVKAEFEQQLQNGKVRIFKTHNLSEVMSDVDVLYMTRVQKERFADLAEYEKIKNYYILTPELMKRAKQNMIVMHPFPRVGEISFAVDTDPRAAYIRSQMQNGLFVRMALLLKIFAKA